MAGLGIGGGFGAGAGADYLLSLVKQRLAEQEARDQAEQAKQRQALAERELSQRESGDAADRALRERIFAGQESDRKQAQTDRETAARALEDSRQRDDARADAEQTLPGSILSGEPAARLVKYAPTTVEPYGLDPGGAANPEENLSGVTPLPRTGQVRFKGTATQQEKQAAIDEKNAPKHSPIYTEWQDAVANGYKGSFTKYQDEDANRKRVSPPRERYQVQPDGKGGLVRVDLDKGTAEPIQMGAAAVQVKGTGGATPAGIQQQQTTATNVRKHLEDVGKEAAILDQMGLMGPVGSRWSDFMAGKVGAGELAAGDPEKAKLLGEFRADVKLLQSGVAMVHGGARGGSSPGMAARMEAIINADRMDLPLFQGALSSFDKWLKGYEKPSLDTMAPMPAHATTGAKKDPLGIR